MKQDTDQALLQFALGELPILRRIGLRVQLLFSRKCRERLAELTDASRVLADANSPYGGLAFHANLAIKLKRLMMIDLLLGLILVGAVIGGVYAVGSQVVDACETTTTTSAGK